MRFDHFIVSLFIAIGLLMAFLAITTGTGGILTNYDVEVNSTIWGDVESVMNDTYDTGAEMKDSVSGEEITSDSALDNMIKGGFKALLKVFDYFKAANKLIVAVGLAIGIPSYITNLLMIALGASALLSLIYMIVRFQPR